MRAFYCNIAYPPRESRYMPPANHFLTPNNYFYFNFKVLSGLEVVGLFKKLGHPRVTN
jgi:hypothetical protein